MSYTQQYDAIVIGAGQGGVPLTSTLAGKNRKTALVERKHVGGTCINTGCTPTKALVASARAAYLARRAADFGVETGTVTVDMVAVRQRKRDMVESFRQGTLDRIKNSGAVLIRGEARFAGPRTLQVRMNEEGTQQIAADTIFIDTGTRPRIPDIPGLDEIGYLDSTAIMELPEIPEHLLIVGGGYVGVEFAQMFRRFGSRVTLVQRGEQLLGHEDEDVAQAVAGILEEDGVQVLLRSQPVGLERAAGDAIAMGVDLGGSDGTRTIKGSHLLIAAGRVPNTEALNLQAAGVETGDRGYIVVNERLETSAEGVYALGDVKGGPAFTHISYDDFRIVRANLLENGEATVHDRPVPYTVFIDPQLGRVGLTEKQARAQGRDYRLAKIPMTSVARALEVEQSRGLMKALVDPETKQILGCAILGIQGGEIMAIVQVAMMGKLPYTALRDGIFTHPTLSESLNTLFTQVEDVD